MKIRLNKLPNYTYIKRVVVVSKLAVHHDSRFRDHKTQQIKLVMITLISYRDRNNVK